MKQIKIIAEKVSIRGTDAKKGALITVRSSDTKSKALKAGEIREEVAKLLVVNKRAELVVAKK